MHSSDEPAQSQPEAIEREATAWFTRINGEPSDEDRQNFQRWMQADPRNESAFREVEALWASTQRPGAQVASEEREQLDVYLREMDRAKAKRRQRRKTGPAIGALVATLIIGAWVWLEHPNFLQDFEADHVTARSERRVVALPDGSKVTLDADSAIDERYGAEARRIRLLRGRASFEVRNATTPFIVETTDGETRALGTQFDVAIEESDVVVTLMQGRVSVSAPVSSRGTTLEAGQSVHYGPAGMGAVSTVAVEDAAAWHEGRFIFNNARLGDVIRQVERYRQGRIVIVGSALADHRVSGSFSLNDSAAALASLQSTVGFTMRSLGGRLVILSR